MKTKLILLGALAISTMANAQWTGTTCPVSTTCDVGIGTASPTYPLDIVTTTADEGIRITQSTNGSASMVMNNTTTGGRNWSIASTGINNNQGAGHFTIYDITGGGDRIFIRGTNGNVGIGTTTTPEKLSVAGNVAPSADNTYKCGTSSNRWTEVWAVNGTIQTSDRRFKTNITSLNYGLKDVLNLKPVSYNWIKGDNKKHLGLIAQELKQVISEVVVEGEDGNLGVAYSELIPVLIQAVKEQQLIIEKQEQRIANLEKQPGISKSVTGLNEVSASEGFMMEQNEPNPFTHETTVKYVLSEKVKVASLVIYDLSGKQVSSLPITERGSSSVKVTSEQLSAGIYIYNIVADGRIMDSKRMVVAQK